MPGAYIIRAGDVCSAVYFIKKGEVVILDEKANMQLCVDVLYENECFGEVKSQVKVNSYFGTNFIAAKIPGKSPTSGQGTVSIFLRSSTRDGIRSVGRR